MRFRKLLLTGVLVTPLLLAAEPVLVEHPEGSVHGYLALRSADGKLLAAGDLVQTIRGAQLTSRLTYRFKDGSIDDETAVFTQRGHFKLIRDHHIQKGPSFSRPTDLSIDTKTGIVISRYMEGGKLRADSTHMDLPDDLANGIVLNLVKNISAESSETKLSYLAAAPKPRIVHLSLKPDGIDYFRSAGLRNKAQRYRVHVELGGLKGLVAPIVGKEPADSFVWVGTGQVPAFIKSENPLYLGGPLLQTELVEPVWVTTGSK